MFIWYFLRTLQYDVSIANDINCCRRVIHGIMRYSNFNFEWHEMKCRRERKRQMETGEGLEGTGSTLYCVMGCAAGA